MRNFLTIILFIFAILIIGRNLTFLPKFNLFTGPPNEKDELKIKIGDFIKKQKGSYGIYYFDLNSGSSFGINEKEIYTAASINKLPTITALYYLANINKANLDEQITLQKEDIQDYGTGRLRYEEPGSVYSLKTLARLALQESDNTANYLIASKIGIDNIQKIINDWGLSQTDINENKTSNYDIFLLFKKIYKNEITTPALTKELLGFLKDTDIEDRLPLLLPKNTIIYHKTGDAIGNIHDIGVIELNGNKFFLGVMTADIGGKENETKKAISQIAKIIIDYKQNQK
ncbi:MAG: serine hydrolase [Candidatus Levyibacteriota bacterium]